MDEDVGSGEGFPSWFLREGMLHEDLLQLVDDMFFVWMCPSINARSLEVGRNSFWLLVYVRNINVDMVM